jgi:protein-disulfide isomerase
MTRPALLAALTSTALLAGAALLPASAWAQDTTDAPADGEAAPAQDSASSDNAATEGAAPTEEAAADPAAIQDMAQGAADAPVTIIEYGSFTCPHCADWHETSYPQLKADYIDTGEVRFIFREIYFDRPGLWASMIARCGGEMRFFPVHDLIYENQIEWIGDQQPATIAENLRRLGISAGLEAEQVDACMADQGQAEALVAWFQGNATADEVEGTPTFIINGEKHSNMPWEDMKAIIDAELAEAGQ